LLEVLLVQNIHALAEAYGATVIRILTTVQKKNLPWIDGLLDASEEHCCNWKTIIQLTL
jgi:hypothetical protein